MNKRLEDIKNSDYSILKVDSDLKRDWDWLINQAELYEEAEEEYQSLSDAFAELYKQNKRYREAKDKLDAIFHERHKPYPSDYDDGYLDGLDRAIGIIEKSLGVESNE